MYVSEHTKSSGFLELWQSSIRGRRIGFFLFEAPDREMGRGMGSFLHRFIQQREADVVGRLSVRPRPSVVILVAFVAVFACDSALDIGGGRSAVLPFCRRAFPSETASAAAAVQVFRQYSDLFSKGTTFVVHRCHVV